VDIVGFGHNPVQGCLKIQKEIRGGQGEGQRDTQPGQAQARPNSTPVSFGAFTPPGQSRCHQQKGKQGHHKVAAGYCQADAQSGQGEAAQGGPIIDFQAEPQAQQAKKGGGAVGTDHLAVGHGDDGQRG
jgi:hypothetical protein